MVTETPILNVPFLWILLQEHLNPIRCMFLLQENFKHILNPISCIILLFENSNHSISQYQKPIRGKFCSPGKPEPYACMYLLLENLNPFLAIYLLLHSYSWRTWTLSLIYHYSPSIKNLKPDPVFCLLLENLNTIIAI